VSIPRYLAEIVVRGDDVDLLPVLLHHPRDERRELLLGSPPVPIMLPSQTPPSYWLVVEVEHVAVVDDRADGFARALVAPANSTSTLSLSSSRRVNLLEF
jgi:hypothetical protein